MQGRGGGEEPSSALQPMQAEEQIRVFKMRRKSMGKYKIAWRYDFSICTLVFGHFAQFDFLRA